MPGPAAVSAACLARAHAALLAVFIADSLSFPAHWFYSRKDIVRYFDRIEGYTDAPSSHPSCIMTLHSTSKGGRGSQGGEVQVIGDVILKGRRHLWGQRNLHYHHGMKAGDNTLNAHCARVVIRSMLLAEEGAAGAGPGLGPGPGQGCAIPALGAAAEGGKPFGYDSEAFLRRYVAFMTAEAPLPHNDTYAESFHRSFFANQARGVPLRKCAEVTHDTPTIGGLVMVVPVVVGEYLRTGSRAATKRAAREHLALTHPSAHGALPDRHEPDAALASVVDSYVELMADLLDGERDPREAIAAAGRRFGVDVPKLVERVEAQHGGRDETVCGNLYSPACYIDGSWPVTLYLAYKYQGDPTAAMLSNTNLGGENCHRGSVLGSIAAAAAAAGGAGTKGGKGAAAGHPFAKGLVRGLLAHRDIEAEISAFLDQAVAARAPAAP